MNCAYIRENLLIFEVAEYADKFSKHVPSNTSLSNSEFHSSREPIVRQGFLSLQLLVNDFLPLINATCIAQCVEVTGGFGLQRAELNISLTAVGLLVSDEFVSFFENSGLLL